MGHSNTPTTPRDTHTYVEQCGELIDEIGVALFVYVEHNLVGDGIAHREEDECTQPEHGAHFDVKLLHFVFVG